MRYVENKRKGPDPCTVMLRAKQLRADCLKEVVADTRKGLHKAAIKGFNAIARLIGPETTAEQRRRRKARAIDPYVAGNVQGLRMTIPAHRPNAWV